MISDCDMHAVPILEHMYAVTTTTDVHMTYYIMTS